MLSSKSSVDEQLGHSRRSTEEIGMMKTLETFIMKGTNKISTQKKQGRKEGSRKKAGRMQKGSKVGRKEGKKEGKREKISKQKHNN